MRNKAHQNFRRRYNSNCGGPLGRFIFHTGRKGRTAKVKVYKEQFELSLFISFDPISWENNS